MMQVILQPPGLMPRFGLGGLPLNLLLTVGDRSLDLDLLLMGL